MQVCLLIVDDEAEVAERLAAHFRSLGYEVDTAGDAIEGMRKFQNGHYPVVITDLVMPGLSGIDLVRAVKAYGVATHVIVITGYCATEYVLESMRLGADVCLLKPLEDLTAIERAVEHAVEEIQNWQNVLVALEQMRPADYEAETANEAAPDEPSESAQDMVEALLREAGEG